MIRSLSSQYHPLFAAVGVAIELLQCLSFAINPHVAGNVTAWSILYIVQLPYWDATYAKGMSFSQFLAFYWVVCAWIPLIALALVVGVEYSHFISSAVLQPYLRHVVHLGVGVMFVPVVQTLLTTMSCTSSPTRMADQQPYSLWLFESQSCADSVVTAHKGISIALILMFTVLALVVAACMFPVELKSKSIKKRAHPYVDLAALLYKLGICTAFHLLLPRGMVSYYSFIVAVCSIGMAVVYGFVLPFLDRTMNTVHVVAYALAGWASTVVYIDAKLNTAAFIGHGGFYAVLCIGAVVVGALSFVLSTVRFSAKTDYLISKCTESGFVAEDENPFAVAAKQANPELLPFPSGLPGSDFVFSPHRIVEAEVIEEAIRNEEDQVEDIAYHTAAGVSAADAVKLVEEARLKKYIGRVQVVSASIEVAWLPTDAEVSTRFLADWIHATDAPPTPHMLSFACRLFARFLLKFPSSPTATIAYVRFLTEYAPSLSRMNLSVKLLDALPNEMFCDLFHLYQMYSLTLSVKEVLGVRDKNHEKMYRKSRRLHKETLVQTASVWRSLLDEDRNAVTLCFLAHTLSEVRSECFSNYTQSLKSSTDDETLLRSFANFVENVTQDSATASLCLDEADAIGKRRRAKLIQRVEGNADAQNNGDPSAPSAGAGSASRSSMSRMTRGDEDAIIALRSILDSVAAQARHVAQHLNSRSVYVTSIVMFVFFCCVLGVVAAVVLSQYNLWSQETSRSYYAGDLRSKSQQVIAQLYRVASVLPLDNTSTFSSTDLAYEVDKLVAFTNAFESTSGYMTHGSGKQHDKELVRFVKSPTIFVEIYTSPTTFEVQSFNYWNAVTTLVQYLIRVADLARTAPIQVDFLRNVDVLFLRRNVRAKYGEFLSAAITQQMEAHNRQTTTSSTMIGVVAAVCAVLVLGGAYVFVWNFRRSASAKAQTLKLFFLIPTESLKRIAGEAKVKVERFISGENMAKDDHNSSLAGLGSSLEGVSMDGSAKMASGDMEDEDGRRTSYATKLLTHLFQHGAVETMDEEKKEDTEDDKGNGEWVPPAPVGLESTSADGKPSSQGVPSPKLGTKKDSAMAESFVTFEEGKGLEPKHSEVGKERRRHSISLGNAMKNVDQAKHRASILDMVDTGAASDDDNAAETALDNEHNAATQASVGNEEEEIEKNSFAVKSGLTSTALLLLLSITVTSVVGIAFTSQILSETSLSVLNVDRIEKEMSCALRIRDSSLDMFFDAQRAVASRSYTDYQYFSSSYMSFMSTYRECSNVIDSLGKIDAGAYTQFLTQFRINLEIAVALTAADFSPEQNTLLHNLRWQAQRKTFVRTKVFETLVSDVERTWFPYTTQDQDMALNSTARFALAQQVLYSEMGFAVFDEYLKSQKELAAAVSEKYVLALKKLQASIASSVGVSVAMWALCAGLCVAFVVQWTGAPFARKIAIVLAIACCVCVAIGIAVNVRSEDRVDLAVVFSTSRQRRMRFRDSVARQFYHGYASVFVSTDATIFNYMKETQPIELSNNQAALLLELPFAAVHPESIAALQTFLLQRGDINRMLMVALKLVTTARGATLFNAEPRLAAVRWNRTSESTDEYLTLKYPSDDALMYTNYVDDLNLPEGAMLKLAESIMATQRASEFTRTMLTTVSGAIQTMQDYHFAQAHKGDAAFYGTQQAYIAVAAIAMVTFVGFILSIGVAAINSFSETQTEADLYEALYASFSNTIAVGLVLVVAAIVAVGAAGIVFTYSDAADQRVLFSATERSFLAARGMSYIEEMYSTASMNERTLTRSALQSTIDQYLHVAQGAYFGSVAAFALRKDQNEALFSPESNIVVRDTRNTMLTAITSASSTCYNPVNRVTGNQQSVSILLTHFFDLLDQVVHLDASTYATAGSLPTSMAPYIRQARLRFDTLLDVLQESDDAFRSTMESTHSTRLTIIIIILLAALVILILVLTTTVVPVIKKMTLHETGVRQLLLLLPEDVRNQVPEIADFFDADAGTKDDQIKKKLLQSEKLLQNILPPVISRRLKNGERVIADTHPNVTVMFAAIIGFDEYSAKMEAKEIVHFLNSLIVTFDQISDLLELEKIKTIGDIYFLCGGLTKKTESDHPIRCMDCALLFMEAITESNVRHNTPNLTLRIGINTDPAVAGVIGSKKVAYDLWGDSVNTASRMQSTGLPGKIQVSDKTYHLIKEFYAFTDRKVAAKGKGELTTHLYSHRLKNTPYRNVNWRIATR